MEDFFTLELLHVADQEAGGAAIQDAPRLSAVLNALKAEDLGEDDLEDNTLVLSSGDAFIPGLFFDASDPVFGAEGIADIQIQNELGVQAIALGNHEFDFGTRVLSELITGQDVTDDSDPDDGFVDTIPQSIGSILGSEFAGANFPYLSTNLNFAPDENLAPLEVEGGQAPQPNTVTSSVIIDVNGENVGVIGATTPTLASISNAGNVGISPSPFDANPTPEQLDALAAEIQTEVDALLAANPGLNKVVLLAHMQQLAIELGLAERLENVDIIVAGGSNTRLFDANDRIRAGDSNQGEYPQFVTNAGGTQTVVVSTDGSYKYVGRLVLAFDESGNIIPESYDPEVSGAYATDAQGVADLNAENLVDPEIQEIVDAIEAQIISTESNVFGTSNVFLNGNRSGTETADDPDGVRTQETNLGNLTADANLAAAKEIDPTVVVSLKNGGGIRASIGQTLVPPGSTESVRTPNEAVVDSQGTVVKPEGGISQNDIQTTLAFNNGLTLLTLTREELVAVLEHGVSALPNVAGAFPQISGVKFSYDPDLAAGDRLQSAAIFDEADTLVAELVRDGELVGDPGEAFRIVTLSFLAAPRFDEATGEFTGGGDGYPFPNTNLDPTVGEVGAPDIVARVNTVQLEQEGEFTGDATFADDGSEQDALAEYLFDNFTDAPFDQVDTGRALDERIQNLNFRKDTVLGDVVPPPPTGDTFQLQLLHATDQEGAAPALVDAPNLSAVLNALEDDFENTLILSSGDLWLPGLFYSASAEIYGFTNAEGEFEGIPGIADVLINSALGIQAAAFGNHEFDQGTGAIRALLEANPDITGPGIGEAGYQGAAFPYLSANLDFSADPNLADLVVEDGQDVSTIPNKIAKSAIAEVSGEKIGIVGATTPTLQTISSPGDGVGVSPADPEDYDALAAIIQAEVDELLANNPDLNKVVLLTHMQVLNIEVNELAPRLSGVDIIVGGGSDTILADETDRLRDGDAAAGPYPIIQTAADGNPIAIVNTDGQYLYVGQLVVEFDANGIIIEGSIDPAISGAYATDEAGVAALGAEGLTDPVISEVIDALNSVIEEKERNVFGITENFLNGRRAGGGLDGVRNQETNLGNLTADANLWYGRLFDETVQISIKNGGGIRESIGSVVTPPGGTEPVRLAPDGNLNFGKPDGGITQTDVESVLAFNNGLSLVTVTVEELKDILEHTVSRATEENINSDFGSFGQVSGVAFSFDIDFQPRETDPITGEETVNGERIRSLALVDEMGEVTEVLVQDGEIQGDPTRTFRLITLNFLANGGSGYPIPQTERVDLVEQSGFDVELADFAETGSEQDALAEYLATFFPADEDPTTPVFTQVDTPPEEDERIQNLFFREDTVLGDTPSEPSNPDFSDGFEGPFSEIGRLVLEEGAEINAFDPESGLLFVVSGSTVLQIVDLSDPANPVLSSVIDLDALGGGINSVAVKDGVVALAIEANTSTDNGVVVFFTPDGQLLDSVDVGSVPDMVTFTPDGNKVLVANEGEPNDDYSVDPEGSISIIDISNGVENASVETADFTAFNSQKTELQAEGVKLFGLDATVAEDLEPEYIAVAPDGSTAWVTLQENNAVAVIDIEAGAVDAILPLGVKDFSDSKLDASNRDGAINLQNWPIFGLYQPDSIASYEVDGVTYYVTANEGDARIRPDGDLEDDQGNVILEEGAVFNEESRIGDEDVILDPDAFPNAAELKLEENLGRLKITNTLGDLDGDGDFDQLFSYGGRSFSIWDENGNLVFDSGDDIAQITAQLTPDLFNANDGDPAEFDDRSDDKGAEPEALTVGQIGDTIYAFVGLERAGGGVLIYDISDPNAAEFVQYVRSDEDIAPEGISFVSSADSPNGSNLLLVTNEESSTLAVYADEATVEPVTELLDLTGFDSEVTANVTASREAAFDNILQFYATDAQGTVDGLLPGDAGYENAVRQNLLGLELFVENRVTIDADLLLSGGTYYAPALLVDGNVENLVTIDDAVTGMSMIQRDGNVWTFEDLTDFDFNDLVFTVNSAEAAMAVA